MKSNNEFAQQLLLAMSRDVATFYQQVHGARWRDEFRKSCPEDETRLVAAGDLDPLLASPIEDGIKTLVQCLAVGLVVFVANVSVFVIWRLLEK